MAKPIRGRQLSRSVTMASIAVAVAIGLYVGWRASIPEPVDLSKHEERVYSQNGEDGVVAKIFEIIEPTSYFAVEFGGGDGVKYSNVRRLYEQGWGGLLIEGDPELAAAAVNNYADNPKVKAIQAWVWPGNIELLFEDNGVPKDLDFLVIDIDSNDYYVWRAIRDFRPKLVMVEFNGAFAPPQKAVVKFHPMNYWDGSDYFGASIQSYYELGKEKGYELVYCESRGRNLFFVDRKYYERFGLKDNRPVALYHPPATNMGFGRGPEGRGHPAWDLYTEKDPETGELVYPLKKPLTWKNLEVPKEFVER